MDEDNDHAQQQQQGSSSHDSTTHSTSNSSRTGRRRRSGRKSKSSSRSKSGENYSDNEPLQKAYSLVRRIIRPVFSYTTRCPEEEAAPNQLVLDLCRQFPALATTRFPTHSTTRVELTPLKFLLQNKANLQVLTDFCQAFPDAVRMFDDADTTASTAGDASIVRQAVATAAQQQQPAQQQQQPQQQASLNMNHLDGYPLHVACSARQDEGDIIALLAHAFPEAARYKNQAGYLPLHLLLEYRGVTPALTGVQALVRVYPESTILRQQSAVTVGARRNDIYAPPPVFSVFSLSHCTAPLMECILGHVPRHVTSLQFPIGCFTDDTVHPHHAQALTRVLPQLQQLELVPPNWHPQGWTTFATACSYALVAKNIRTLVLKAPKYDPHANYTTAARNDSITNTNGGGDDNDDDQMQDQQQLQQLHHHPNHPRHHQNQRMQAPRHQQQHASWQHNQAQHHQHQQIQIQQQLMTSMIHNLINLQSLSLTVDYHPQEVRNLTQPLAHLLSCPQGQLQHLRVDGFPLQLPILYQALIGNTKLTQLILNELVVSPTAARALPLRPSVGPLQLSHVLQQGNVTLQTAATVSFTGQLGDEYSKIQYWASLNRLGRGLVRKADADAQVLLPLLAQVATDDVLQGRSCDVQSILYGLLRESPGSWSNSNIGGSTGTTADVDMDQEDNAAAALQSHSQMISVALRAQLQSEVEFHGQREGSPSLFAASASSTTGDPQLGDAAADDQLLRSMMTSSGIAMNDVSLSSHSSSVAPYRGRTSSRSTETTTPAKRSSESSPSSARRNRKQPRA